jgi:hypothetical protein
LVNVLRHKYFLLRSTEPYPKNIRDELSEIVSELDLLPWNKRSKGRRKCPDNLDTGKPSLELIPELFGDS